ncbi:MAG: N-acetylglucosamine-6-phosphate deacetylase, partial [Sulfolobales archaeon]
MYKTILKRCRIVSSEGVIENGYLVIEGGVVIDMGRGSPAGYLGSEVDLEGYTVFPGFIDTHTHGVRGLDATLDRDPGKILEMARRYVEYGVTGFLPTTVTAPHEVLLEACRSVGEAMDMWGKAEGARILGIHFEGPYINPEAAGAQNRLYIRSPDLREFRDLVESCRGVVRQITIAPELEGAESIIAYAREHGIVVSAGHSNASYEEALRAIELGVSKATHIFNSMRRFHHRDPGIALAMLQSPNIYVEVIADFIHLHRAVVKMIIDYISPERAVLITDSIAATGMQDGIYELGGLKVIVERGVCRLANTGELAGSTLTMNRAIANIISLGYPPEYAAKMSSLTPAKSIGI